jgi:hypothetical protein
MGITYEVVNGQASPHFILYEREPKKGTHLGVSAGHDA